MRRASERESKLRRWREKCVCVYVCVVHMIVLPGPQS